MNAIVNRARGILALGTAALVVGGSSLATAPTASACPIYPDGTCVITKSTVGTTPLKTTKKHKAHKTHKAHKIVRGY